MNKQEIIQDYKNGMTIAEIARKNHVANSTISGYIKPLNLPNNKVIVGINNWEGFKEFFSQIDADIFCIQETKMQQDQIDTEILHSPQTITPPFCEAHISPNVQNTHREL